MQIHDHAPNAWGRSFLWGGILLGLLLVTVLLTHGFGLFGAGKAADTGPAMMVRQGNQIVIPESSPLRKRLTVTPAHAEAVSAKLVLPAVVESDPARTAAVLTPLGGRVVEIKVALGDRVRQGQVLAVIDSPDLGQAFDDNDKAADAAQLTQKNLTRQEEQFKLGTASNRDLDQARSDNAQASSEYARTQARLKVLGVSAERRQHSTALSVQAPVSGSVTTLTIARGNMINDPTQPIMTVADLSTVWVTALVPEKDVAAVAKDQDAEVSLSAYPGRVLHGKVLFISDIIEPDSRRDKLRIAFPNADVSLKPNMFATVTLVGPKETRVILPTSALLMNNDRTSVFVATAPWTFERRVVEAQLEEGPTVTLGSGVKDGEQVVVKGGILLND
ncbi:MAG TPA: efflux RND transporter periplasmic adaptor subunit [Steroidobacteraceae bacterium]|nr:efflux RND transporter periplasmic adaptor subunit [Steroidobacteraceae bacterium]